MYEPVNGEMVESMVRTLAGVDAARRVGWAKAYSAESDLGVLHERYEYLHERYEYLFGFLWGYLDGEGLPRTVIENLIMPVELAGEIMDAGERAGQDVRNAHDGRTS